jgi:hypothetical protein
MADQPKTQIFVIQHDDDCWVLQVAGRLTLTDLTKDDTTIFMCNSYSNGMFITDGRLMTAERCEKVRASFRHKLASDYQESDEAAFGLTYKQAAVLVRSNLEAGVLKVIDPTRVGRPDADISDTLLA